MNITILEKNLYLLHELDSFPILKKTFLMKSVVLLTSVIF